MDWEIGDPEAHDQTPNVVFLDGALIAEASSIDAQAGVSTDTFLAFYGGSDTAVGSMRVYVDIQATGVVVEPTLPD